MARRKRMPRGSSLLFFSFFLISICCLLVTSAARINAENQLYSGRFYSDHARSFSVLDPQSDEVWENALPMVTKQQKDFSIYYPVLTENEDIQGVYVSGGTRTPPLQSGRFFTEADCIGETPCAVVGHSYEQQIHDGKIRLLGKDYNVLGVMGTERDSRINEMIFIDFQSAVAHNGIAGSYVLDAADEGKIDAVSISLNENLLWQSKVYIALPENIEDEPVSYALLGGSKITQTLYTLILISFLLSGVFVSLIWVSHRRQAIAVERMVGWSNGMVCMEIGKHFFSAVLPAFVAGLLGVLLSGFVQATIRLQWQDVLLSVLLTAGLALIVCCITTIRALRMPVNRMLQ